MGKLTQLTKLLSAKETAGKRHAWWLEFDWIGRCEEAVLGVSTGFSQISGAQRQDGIANFYLYLVTSKIRVLIFYTHVRSLSFWSGLILG